MTRRSRRSPGEGSVEMGLLLESDGRSGIALTRDGRFVRVACRPEDEEGSEIVLRPESGGRSVWGLVSSPADGLERGTPAGRTRPERGAVRAGSARRALRPGLAAAAVVLLCLLAASPFAVGRVLASGDPVAYVSVDINPSVEFGVNRWDRVVTAQALNEDGEALLAGLGWEGRPLGDVLDDVASAAVDLGYLEPGGDPGAFLVAVVPAAESLDVPPGLQRQLERAREAVGAALAERGVQVEVETVLADAAAMREQARELGLSVGKYSVLLVAQEAGLDLEAQDLNRGVGRAILAAGGHPGEVLREAHQVKKISKLAEKFEEKNGLDRDNKGGQGQGQGQGQGGPDDGSRDGPEGAKGDETGAGDPPGHKSDDRGRGNGRGQGRGGGRGHDDKGAGTGAGGPPADTETEPGTIPDGSENEGREGSGD